jgi:hypothetical protein
VNFHELDSYRVLVRGIAKLVQATMAAVIWTGHLLRPAERVRNGWTFVVQEMALEVLWAKQVAARLVAIMPFMAACPIRTSARLLLRFVNWGDQTAILKGKKLTVLPIEQPHD